MAVGAAWRGGSYGHYRNISIRRRRGGFKNPPVNQIRGGAATVLGVAMREFDGRVAEDGHPYDF